MTNATSQSGIARQQARDAGQTKYEGKRCKQCRSTVRYTSCCACCNCSCDKSARKRAGAA